MGLPIADPFQCARAISHKRLKTLSYEFVCEVKACTSGSRDIRIVAMKPGNNPERPPPIVRNGPGLFATMGRHHLHAAYLHHAHHSHFVVGFHAISGHTFHHASHFDLVPHMRFQIF